MRVSRQPSWFTLGPAFMNHYVRFAQHVQAADTQGFFKRRYNFSSIIPLINRVTVARARTPLGPPACTTTASGNHSPGSRPAFSHWFCSTRVCCFLFQTNDAGGYRPARPIGLVSVRRVDDTNASSSRGYGTRRRDAVSLHCEPPSQRHDLVSGSHPMRNKSSFLDVHDLLCR